MDVLDFNKEEDESELRFNHTVSTDYGGIYEHLNCSHIALSELERALMFIVYTDFGKEVKMYPIHTIRRVDTVETHKGTVQ